MNVLLGTGLILVVAVVAIMVFLHFVPLGLWISAIAAGVRVGIFTLVGMRLRRVPPSYIVMPLIKANKAGLDVSVKMCIRDRISYLTPTYLFGRSQMTTER